MFFFFLMTREKLSNRKERKINNQQQMKKKGGHRPCSLLSVEAQQATVALSSGESEWYSVPTGLASGLGLLGLLQDSAYLSKATTNQFGTDATRTYSVSLGAVTNQRGTREALLLSVRGKNNQADPITKAVRGKLKEPVLESTGGSTCPRSGETPMFTL